MSPTVPGSMSLTDARRGFSVEPGYLDTASVGAPPDVVIEAMGAALTAWQRGRARPQDYDGAVTEARASFARLVNVSADDVCVGSQVSALVGMIAASLPDGARVLAVDGEFTSAIFPFLAHGSRNIETVFVPLRGLADAIDARTDLVAFSAVQSADGAVADLGSIAAAASFHGVKTLVDTTQACGWLPFDASLFDVTVCSAYKWLLSPRGTAFMTVRPSMLDGIRPLAAGWYGGEDIWSSIYGPPLRLATTARRLDVSPAWLCWVGTAPALALIEQVGIDTVHAHDVALANRVRLGLGMERSDSAIVRVESPTAAAALASADIRASTRAGAVRLAFHLTNTVEDADRVIDVVTSAAAADGP